MARYSVGYDAPTTHFFRERRAATHAAFFLPHVQRGMSLLDGGCGPGSITLDLAEVVAPATVVGIDIAPSQVALAQEQVGQRGVANLHGAAAALYALPFPAEAFHAVFLHGVLEHLQAPVAALCEVHRVLKRGGVVGLRHADFGGFLLEPAPPPLDQFATLFARLMLYNGADPQAGRHQRRWLEDAGFVRPCLSASYDCWTPTPAETQRHAAFLASLVSASAFAQQIMDTGLDDEALLTRMQQGFVAWGNHPHAFAAEAWGEAVAWKP
jgi:ubiquinone/menaquinone biosynthesis C-methylase UbiE